MTTKAAIQLILDTLHSEISGNPSVTLVEGIDSALNDSLLICGYRERYNGHVDRQLTIYSNLLDKINNIQEIPKTLEIFNNYWQACKTS